MQRTSVRDGKWKQEQPRLIQLLLEHDHVDASPLFRSQGRDEALLLGREVHCGSEKFAIVGRRQAQHDLGSCS